MAKANYVGNDIFVSFVALENGEALEPTRALVTVYSPNGKKLKTGTAKVDNNEITYLIPGDIVKEVGKYFVVFEVFLPGRGQQTNPMEILVEPLPIGEHASKDRVFDIGEEKEKSNWKENLEKLGDMLWRNQQ